MGKIPYFWDDSWVGQGIILRERFPHIAGIFLEPGITMGKCIVRGGELEVGDEVGEDDCVCGKRKCWMFTVLCYIILFCRITFMIGGYGKLLTSSHFLSRKLIGH
jgi:hypothetical protein